MMRWSQAGRVELSRCGNNCCWQMVVHLPECDHPQEYQVVTRAGTKCDKCGHLQPRYDKSETAGVDA